MTRFLTAEAVGLALVLEAGIRVTPRSPLMQDACRALRIELQVVEL